MTLQIARLLACPTDVSFMDAYAREALQQPRFSLADEFTLSQARIWLAYPSTPEQSLGLLVSWEVAGELEIIALVVHPLARRQKIALRLLQELLHYSRSSVIAKIFLEVRASNQAACNLYEGLGFTEIARRIDYYDHPRESAIVMQQSVASCG